MSLERPFERLSKANGEANMSHAGLRGHAISKDDDVTSSVYQEHLTHHAIIGFSDAGHNSDPTNSRAQSGYCFMKMGAAISWKSFKQLLATTSSNGSEQIALYETTREGIWLRELEREICSNAGLPFSEKPIIIYEDNKACLDQLAKGYIRGDKIKHIAPKYFFTHDVHGIMVQIRYIQSSENIADIFTKTLPNATHQKLVRFLGIRPLADFRQRM